MEVSLSAKVPFIREMIAKVQGTVHEAKWKRIHRLVSSGK
jgi:hypothetical protein